MPAERLRLRNFLAPGAAFHIARLALAAGDRFKRHRHDFSEVFWIERGGGTHLVNAGRQALAPGALVFVRPDDAHAFAAGAEGLTLVNVAFAATTLRDLRRRYLAAGERCAWMGGKLPATFTLGRAPLRELTDWADSGSAQRLTRLELDFFLIRLLRAMAVPAAPPQHPPAPPWLTDGVARFAVPAHFADGPTGLARLCARTPEHLNRVVRQCYGKTATDLVNELRLDHAARELRMTSRAIVDIALDCGLSHLGHFYKLFTARFGVPPRRYRLAAQATMPSATS